MQPVAPAPEIAHSTHPDSSDSGNPPASTGQTSIGAAEPGALTTNDQHDDSVNPDSATGARKQISEDEHGLRAPDTGEHATPPVVVEPVSRTERPPPTESWIAYEVSSRAGTFLWGERSGVWFRPAPPGQRFVVINASVSWDGRNAHQLALRASDVGYPRLWMRVDQKRVYSIGRLPAEEQPLLPPSLELIPCKPRERIDVAFAFLVPNEVRQASLEVERQVLANLDFEAPATAEPGEFVGSWRRVPSHRRPLRFADQVSRAIAAADCQILRVVEDPGGAIRLLIPCAQRESEPLGGTGAADGFAVTLHAGPETDEAYLRVVARNPLMLLLYVGDPEEGGKFLYERYGN